MERTCEEEGCSSRRDAVTCVDSPDSTRSCLHVDFVLDPGSRRQAQNEERVKKKTGKKKRLSIRTADGINFREGC